VQKKFCNPSLSLERCCNVSVSPKTSDMTKS
jgi:hypothetical protein